MPAMHEVDYEILGDDMQFVRVELDPCEAVIGEAGSMMYIEDGIEMQTIFGDGSGQQAGGFMGALFGGEGLFFATLRGPGKVWLQSLPFSRLASRIYAAAPQRGGQRREEGSILGGLGDLLSGDRGA